MKTGKIISAEAARKLSRILSAKNGSPEGGSPGCDRRGTEYQWTWRYRVNDGSAFARLGFGPTRKMVTLSELTDKCGVTTCRIWVHICNP